MNNETYYKLIGAGVALFWVAICVYLSGWTPERGAIAFFLGVVTPLFCMLVGASLSEMFSDNTGSKK